jgi:S1-C subfamily serine protease
MVGRSKADRRYGTFFHGDVPEPEMPPPRRRFALRARARALAQRTQRAQLVLMSILGTLAIIGVTNTLAPAPARLSERDVSEAIKTALASATPKPNVAIAAYEAVKESMVLVKTRSGDETAARVRGSGVLLDSGGRILTSLHILRDAAEIKIVFFDGEEWAAVIGDTQAEFDVAVLELGSFGRKPATLASAKGLKVGDQAIVVASPLGQQNSLTVGVISKLGSTFQPPWPGQGLGGLIQFDATLYPESSGGALVNGHGEVVAIVTGGPSLTGLSGLGFAVPIDAAASAAGAAPF